MVMGSVIIVATIEPYFVIAVFFIAIGYSYFADFYKTSAREVKRLGSSASKLNITLAKTLKPETLRFGQTFSDHMMKKGRNRVVEMFTIPRNGHAALASWFVMFAYYSSNIFVASGFTQVAALACSLGFGALNWLFAIPAIFTIDIFGRRNLLLFTFPCMAICLLITGFSFWSTSETGRVAGVSIGIYLFAISHFSGEGPTPFTYSAEVFPLYIRNVGMSIVTATTWFWNFVLSITWHSLILAFKPQGAFGWYAARCCILWVLILLLVRETKGKTLEKLDQVFAVPLGTRAAYGLRQIPYGFKKFVLFQNPVPEQLYQWESENEVSSATGNDKARAEMKVDLERANV